MARNSPRLINLLPSDSRSNWNLEMLVLRRGENRSTRRKTSRTKDENQQQTQSTYDAESENRTRANGRQMLNHCAIPAPLTIINFSHPLRGSLICSNLIRVFFIDLERVLKVFPSVTGIFLPGLLDNRCPYL